MTGQHVDRLCHISGMKLVYYKKYRLGVIVMNDYSGLSLNDLYAFSLYTYMTNMLLLMSMLRFELLMFFCVFIELDLRES